MRGLSALVGMAVSAGFVGLAAVAGLALSSCDMEPDVGEPIHERCADGDTDPDTDVSFEQDFLTAIVARTSGGCLSCHDPSSPTPVGVEIGGLDLRSYESLRAGGVNSGANIVVAGQPCDSVLFQKLAPGPPFGSRMPLNGPPFLTSEELTTLHDWIAEGARDN